MYHATHNKALQPTAPSLRYGTAAELGRWASSE